MHVWFPLALVVAAVVFQLVIRILALDEPIERDSGIYLEVANSLLDGRTLYTEALDIKPPGIYTVVAVFSLFLSSSGLVLFFVACSALLIAGLSLWRVLQLAGVPPILSSFALCLGSLFAADIGIEGTQPNVEMWMNATLLLGASFLVRGPERTGSLWIAAACLAASSLFKHVAVIPVAAMSASMAVTMLAVGQYARAAKLFFAIMTAGLCVWLAFALWCVAVGSAAQAWQTLGIYPFEYSMIQRGESETAFLAVLFNGYSIDALTPAVWPWLWQVVAIAVGGCIWSLIEADEESGSRHRLAALTLGWLFATPAAVDLPGGGYPHYLQLWLPPLLLGTALLLDRLLVHSRIFSGVLMVLLLVVGVSRGWPLVAASPAEWSVSKYGDQFLRAQRAGAHVKTVLEEGERVFVWGVFPGIYVEAGQWPEVGTANVWLTLPGYGANLAEDASSSLERDLRLKPPDMIVLDPFTMRQTPSEHVVGRWISQNYGVFARSNGFLFAARKGSDLEQRESARASGQ
ncbi:MAG: hypothetical protein R3F22_06775 [Lysobacteraceae bacterium]